MSKLVIKHNEGELLHVEIAGNEIPLKYLKGVTLEMNAPRENTLTLTYGGINDVNIEVDETELIVKQTELP